MNDSKEKRDVAASSEEQSTNIETAPSVSAWTYAVPSIVCTIAAFFMLSLYSQIHWNIMMKISASKIMKQERPIDSELLDSIYLVLTELGILRVAFAVLALIWAIWSFKGRPRWAAMVALGFSICAVLTIFIIM
jgi:sterol desaturase/sphingolipid hydroxylase (fatty acid hydroxylase superfamily)